MKPSKWCINICVHFKGISNYMKNKIILVDIVLYGTETSLQPVSAELQ
jgi:hypothetical protein